ncbi:hypothetical protein NECID01_0796 [Nematocida sp. AWRm77]|nr:hypothetical protein NECID01_0796 [Nematocida sp. AWRm77]
MGAHALKEIERRVANLLKEEMDKDGEKKALLKEIQRSIEDRKSLLATLEKEKEERIDKVKKKRESLNKAKDLLSVREREEAAQRKKDLKKEYEDALYNINKLELVLSRSMPGTVHQIVEIEKCARESGFDNLASAVQEHVVMHMRAFVLEIKDACAQLRVDKLIDLIKSVNGSINELGQVYAGSERKREFWVGIYFEDLFETFSAHFFSSFETNRLDKPEWYLEYLKKNLQAYEKPISILAQVEGTESSTEEENEDASTEERAYFFTFLDRVFAQIVRQKMKESIYAESRQRKELILHHASEVASFAGVLAEEYGYTADLYLGESEQAAVRELFVVSAGKGLEDVLGKRHTEWMDALKILLKKLFSECVALFRVVPGVQDMLLSGTIQKYLRALSTFLGEFLYCREEEQKILVHFIEEVMHLSEEVIDIENDFGVAVGEIVIIDVSYLESFKKEFLSTLKRIIEDRLVQVLKPVESFKYLEEDEVSEFICGFSSAVAQIRKLSKNQHVLRFISEEVEQVTHGYILEHAALHLSNEEDKERLNELLDRVQDVLIELDTPTHLLQQLKTLHL